MTQLKNKYKTILANTALVLFTILFTFIIAEIAFRFTDHKYLLHEAYGFPHGYFIKDEEMGIDYPPNFPPADHEFLGPKYKVFTNRYGCFDWDRDTPEDYAIILGGSTT